MSKQKRTVGHQESPFHGEKGRIQKGLNKYPLASPSHSRFADSSIYIHADLAFTYSVPIGTSNRIQVPENKKIKISKFG